MLFFRFRRSKLKVKKVNAGPSVQKTEVALIYNTTSWAYVIVSAKTDAQTAIILSNSTSLTQWEARTLHNWRVSSPGLVTSTIHLPHHYAAGPKMVQEYRGREVLPPTHLGVGVDERPNG